MRGAIAAAALGALAALAGCGDGEAIVCDFTEAPSVVIGGGTSQTGFLALTDGSEMTVTLGPQGLYMVTPSVRVTGMYPGVSGREEHNSNDPEIAFEAHVGSTLVGGAAREHLGLTPTAAGDEKLGIFMPFSEDRSVYIGMTVTLSVNVSDACGNEAADTLDVVPTQ